MEKETSEFGKGFIYNLILFAKHFEREECEGIKDTFATGLWFNGAGDHLFELEIPEQWKNKEIGKKAIELQDFVIKRRLENPPKEDKKMAIKLTEELGLLIDRELGTNPKKGEYE